MTIAWGYPTLWTFFMSRARSAEGVGVAIINMKDEPTSEKGSLSENRGINTPS
ncbi:hypothetical protein GCM10027217_33720 [Pseudomaricurvus hydrocarbonicus]